MRKSKNLKSIKGITLIALVVTIIVLLILAGITISSLTGENGIFSNAKKARDATRGGEVKETVATAISENIIAKATGGTVKTRANVIDELHTSGKLTDKEVEELGKTNKITIGGITIDFSGLGTITGAKTLVQAFIDGDIKIGDYITDYNDKLSDKRATLSLNSEQTGFYEEDANYAANPAGNATSIKIDSSATKTSVTQTYKADTATTWRVLGLSEDKQHLMIITGSPINKVKVESSTDNWKKDNYLYLEGAEGWYNTSDELVSTNNILDKICKIYDSPLASETRSIRIEDINNALGVAVDKTENKLYKTADSSKTAISGYTGFFGKTYTYKDGDKIPENYLNEKYKYSLETKNTGDTVNGTAYRYDYTDASVIDSSSKLYDVLFSGTTENKNYAKSYWLASSGVVVRSGGCGFGPGVVGRGFAGTGDVLFSSAGRSFAYGLGVRPTVSLKSNITVDDVQISPTGSEEEKGDN